jgi:replicative DNA helicase
MPELIYAKRLCTNITKIPFSALKQETSNLKSQIDAYANNNPKSKILIKEFPPSTITVNHLKAFIKKIQSKGIKIDALVVDYINLLHSPTGNNSYERIKYAAEQLRALSYIFECPIITATQLNRTGYDIKEPGLNTVSESIALPATADVMMSIWQDDTDREHGIIKMGMMKNRFGTNYGNCNLSIDYNTLSITEDSTLNATESSSSSANLLKHLTGDK